MSAFFDGFRSAACPFSCSMTFPWRSFSRCMARKDASWPSPPIRAHARPAADRPAVFETLKWEWRFSKRTTDPGAWNTYAVCLRATSRPPFVTSLAPYSKFDNIVQSGVRTTDPQKSHLRPVTTGSTRSCSEHILMAASFPRKSSNFTPLPPEPSGKAACDRHAGHRRPDAFHPGRLAFQSGGASARRKPLAGPPPHRCKTPTHPQAIWSTLEHVDKTGPQQRRRSHSTGVTQSDATSNPVACSIGQVPVCRSPIMSRIKKIHAWELFDRQDERDSTAMLAENSDVALQTISW